MNEKNRMADLLSQWEELLEQGQEISPEELCREFPQLLGAVAEEIAALKKGAWMNKMEEMEGTISPPSQPKVIDPPDTRLVTRLRILAGRYRLDRCIAEGGCGQVWQGFDLELHRFVAIKVPKSGGMRQQETMEAFLHEARKVAQLKHPGIVQVYDVDRDGGAYFIVSELIDGKDLREMVRNKPFQVKEAVRIVADVARHLHYAHQHGFIHRDIKPANLLIDKQGNVFITDFGIAVTEEEVRKHGSDGSGTLAYMSPEQIEGDGRQIGTQSDIYSLGVVLYELLAGRPPFLDHRPEKTGDQIRNKQPVPIRLLNKAVPQAIERICLNCLAKSPVDRYSTAEDLANELGRWLTKRSMSYLIEKSLLWIGGTCGVVATILGLDLFLSRSILIRPEDVNEKIKAHVEEFKADTKHSLEDYKRWVAESEKANSDKINRQIDGAQFDVKQAVELYNQGAAFHNRNDYKNAIRYYTQAISINQKYADAYFSRGFAYDQMGEYDKAIDDYCTVLMFNPNHSYVYFNTGLIYYKKNDYINSINAYSQAIRINPSYASAYYNRGVTHKDKEKFAEAIFDFSETIRTGNKSPNAYFNLGYCFHRIGDDEKALVSLSEAIRLDQNNSNGIKIWALYYRGAIYKSRKMYYKAIDDFTAVIKLDSNNKPQRWEGASLRHRGAVYVDLHEYDKAIDDFTRSICLKTNEDSHSYYGRGIAFQMTREYFKDVNDFSQATKLEPMNTIFIDRFAWILATCPKEGIRNGKQAVELATKACESSQWKNAAFVETLAAAYAESGNFAEGIKWA